MYSINFTENNKKFCLSLHCNGANSYLFVNGTEIHKFKAKDSEIVTTALCLGNISKEFTVDNMKKTGLNGYIYDSHVSNEKEWHIIVFVVAMTFLNFNPSNVNSLKCVLMNNQEYKTRTKIININK